MRGSVVLGMLVLLQVTSTAWLPDRESNNNHVRRESWHRSKRQISEIFRLYQTLAKENREDQMQARQKIQEIISRVFVSENQASTTSESPARTEANNGTTSSTPRPLVKIDRRMLLANLRRNLRGIGRLFMRELRTALTQSRTNISTYWAQLRKSVSQPISRRNRQIMRPTRRDT